MQRFIRFDPSPEPNGEPSKKRLINANIPRRYWEVKLETVPDKCAHKLKVAAAIAKMHESFRRGRGVYLHGSHGVGKTALGCILLRAAMSRGPNSAYFEMAADLDSHLRDPEATNAEGTPIRDLLLRGIYLTLDEVGGERVSEHDWRHIERVIRERYHHQLPTFYTSNFAPETTFKERASLLDILHETCDSIEVAGEKWR